MNTLRFTIKAFLLSALVAVTVVAQSLTLSDAQRTAILAGGEDGKAAVKAALAASGVDITDADAVKAAVASIVAELSTQTGSVDVAVLQSVSTTVTEAVVEVAAATTGADVSSVAAAASSGATTGAATAVTATGGDATALNAAASAAASGAVTGAVTAARTTGQSATVVSNVAQNAAQAATDTASTVGADATTVASAAESASTAAGAAEVTTTNESNETVVVETVETDVEVETPGDNLAPVKFQTFTLALSYGNFSVTINDQNGDVLVVALGDNTVDPVVSSVDGTINNLVYPAGITLSGTQQANLDTNLTAAATAANGDLVTVVPDTSVVSVSPSS